MGVVSPDSPGFGRDDDQGQVNLAAPVTPADQPPPGAVRSWLVSGVRAFAVDPRRRFGGHGHARRWLAEDRRSLTTGHGTWRQLVSALQRQTVHSGLAQLSADERQVITLVYLEGRTNSQIAEQLGVSVSTVRRRLWSALDHLEQYVRRSGTWLSSILVVGLAYGLERAAAVGRAATMPGPFHWLPKAGATLAAVSITTAALGLVAARPQVGSTPHSIPAVARVRGPILSPLSQAPFKVVATTQEATEVTGAAAGKPAGHGPETGRDRDRGGSSKTGCRPTSWSGPPAVLVEPPDAQPNRPAGGCKPTDSQEVTA